MYTEAKSAQHVLSQGCGEITVYVFAGRFPSSAHAEMNRPQSCTATPGTAKLRARGGEPGSGERDRGARPARALLSAFGHDPAHPRRVHLRVEVVMSGNCPAGQHDWQSGPNGTAKCSRCGAISSKNY